MKRRVFTSLSAVSMVLCLGMGAAWARSGIYADELYIGCPGPVWNIYSSDGTVEFYLFGLNEAHEYDGDDWGWQYKNLGHASWRYLGSFKFEQWLFSLERVFGAVPYWFLTLLAAILPTIWFILHRRDRIKRAGKCKSCGYDLRFSTNTCPECGATIHARDK